MKTIAFTENRQHEVIPKRYYSIMASGTIPRPPRFPPLSLPRVIVPKHDLSFTLEAIGEFLEHTCREQFDLPNEPLITVSEKSNSALVDSRVG